MTWMALPGGVETKGGPVDIIGKNQFAVIAGGFDVSGFDYSDAKNLDIVGFDITGQDPGICGFNWSGFDAAVAGQMHQDPRTGAEAQQLTFNQRLNVTCRILRTPKGRWAAVCRIPTRYGVIKLRASIDEKLLQAQLLKDIARRFRQANAASGFDVQVGLFGFVKKAFKSIKRVVKKIAKAKIIRRIGRTIRKVVNSPVVAKLAGFAKYVPGYGTAIYAGYKAARRAVRVADRLTGRRGRGAQKQTMRKVFALRRMIGSKRSNARQRMRGLRALNMIRSAYRRRYHRWRRVARRGGRVSGFDVDIGAAERGFMQGARVLWSELKPQLGVGPNPFRAWYAEGLRAAAAGSMWDELKPHLGTSAISPWRAWYREGLLAAEGALAE